MKMKLIGMVAFALLMPALAVWAQEEGGPQGGGPEGGPGGPPPMAMREPQEHPMLSTRFLDMLEKRLTLTSEQKAKVQETIAGAKDGLKKKFDEVRKAHKEMQALEKDLSGKIRAALTDEQKKAFDEMERMRPRGPGMGRGMGPGGRGQGRGRRGQGGGEGQGGEHQPPQEGQGGQE